MKNPLTILGILLLAGIFYVAIYPFLIYPQQMQAFCKDIDNMDDQINHQIKNPSNSQTKNQAKNQFETILQIKKLAESKGFRVHENMTSGHSNSNLNNQSNSNANKQSKEKYMIISDPRTIGKFTCHIEFTDNADATNGLSASYFAD